MCEFVEENKNGWKFTIKNGYELIYDVTNLKLPDLDCRPLNSDKIIAKVRSNKLSLLPGYAWDGCTGIGQIIETADTIIASGLHDWVYGLAENMDVPYSQTDADQIFALYLPKALRLLYYPGVRIFGQLYYGDKTPSLNITIIK